MASAIVPPVKLRSLKSDRSTTGCSSVSSHTIKNASAITAINVNTTMVVELNQSRSLPLSSMICSEPTQITSRLKPTVSMGALRITESRSRKIANVAIAATMPTGMVTEQIHGHEIWSEIQ